MKAHCLKILLPALTLLFLCQYAQAQTPEEARNTLETAITQILDCIKSPRYADPATRPAIVEEIKQEVSHVFDFREFSSRTVGQRWRTFTPQEQNDFSDAFASLLFSTYLSRVSGYNGEKVEYGNAATSPDGKLVEIRTNVVLSDGKKTPVNYRMMFKDGQWRVYDVIIENISLVRNYRTQFQDILKSASPQDLIAMIKQRAADVASKGLQQGN